MSHAHLAGISFLIHRQFEGYLYHHNDNNSHNVIMSAVTACFTGEVSVRHMLGDLSLRGEGSGFRGSWDGLRRRKATLLWTCPASQRFGMLSSCMWFLLVPDATLTGAWLWLILADFFSLSPILSVLLSVSFSLSLIGLLALSHSLSLSSNLHRRGLILVTPLQSLYRASSFHKGGSQRKGKTY